MKSLQITFLGVCTHFRGVVPGVPHRVVLPDASAFQFGIVDIQDERRELTYFVTPHLAELRAVGSVNQRALTAGQSLQSGAVLNGVRVQVTNAVETELRYSNYNVESLSQFAHHYEWSDEVVLGGRAACYFDLFGGTITTVVVNHTRNVRVTLQTDGDPELLITPFLSPSGETNSQFRSSYRAVLSPTEGELAVMTVGNISQACHDIGGEKRFDYLLHYLTAKGGIPRTLKKQTPGLGEDPRPMTQVELDSALVQMSTFHLPHGLKPLGGGELTALAEPEGPTEAWIVDAACSNSGYP